VVAAPGNFNFDDMSTLLASPPPGKTTQLSGRIPTLDGWRGIAILLVLVNHFRVASGPEDWSYYLGQQGVAIFFVLSGYLISSNLLRERETNGKIALPRFYMRRFLRLAPTAICYLLFVKLVMRVRILPVLFFYRNYVEGSAFTGQFWSLSIEEQFYLAWPLFLVALRPRVALGVALGGAFSVAAWRFFSTQEMMYTYWWGTARTQYRADALLLGCALAILMRWTRARDNIKDSSDPRPHGSRRLHALLSARDSIRRIRPDCARARGHVSPASRASSAASIGMDAARMAGACFL